MTTGEDTQDSTVLQDVLQEENGTLPAEEVRKESTSADAADGSVASAEESASSEESASPESPEKAEKGVRSPDKKSKKKAPPTPDQFQWYVVNAYSGYEMKVKRALEERIRTSDLEDYFGEVRVPEETVVELVRGQKKTSTRKFFPGYMLVQMFMNRDTWHLVNETPKVTGFVGDGKDPQPILQEEVNRILQQVEEGAAAPKAKMNFQEGETVKVVDGPFADFNGTVEEVKPDKGKVKVLISIFGRATPVELDFIQVEKA